MIGHLSSPKRRSAFPTFLSIRTLFRFRFRARLLATTRAAAIRPAMEAGIQPICEPIDRLRFSPWGVMS
jgi:hypothetical protein